jgi:hypothetical protein
VLDGSSSTEITDPTTGKKINLTTESGKTTIVYLDDGELKYEQREATIEDLPNFAIQYLQENSDILEKVSDATGWDRDEIMSIDVSDREEPVVTAIAPVSISETDAAEGEKNTVVDGKVTGEGNVANADSVTAAESDTVGATPDAEVADEGESTKSKTTVNANKMPQEELAEAKAKVAFENSENKAMLLSDGIIFDPVYYAAAHPDVVAQYGSSADALLWHWLNYGSDLGYPPVAPVTTANVAETPKSEPNADNTESASDSSSDNDDSDKKDDSSSTSEQIATPEQTTTPEPEAVSTPEPAPASNSTPDPTQTQTQTQTSSTPVVTLDASGEGTLENGTNVAYNNGDLEVAQGGVVNLPLIVRTNSGDVTIDSLNQVSHMFENIGFTATISYGSTTVSKIEVQGQGGPSTSYSCSDGTNTYSYKYLTNETTDTIQLSDDYQGTGGITVNKTTGAITP